MMVHFKREALQPITFDPFKASRVLGMVPVFLLQLSRYFELHDLALFTSMPGKYNFTKTCYRIYRENPIQTRGVDL